MSHRSRPFDDADLHSFVDGQMDLGRRASFVQALAGDPEMRARVESWKRQNEALTATFSLARSEPVPVRLMPTSLNRESRPESCAGTKPEAERAHSEPLAEVHRSPAIPGILAVAAGAFLTGLVCSYGAAGLGFGPSMFAGRHPIESALPTGNRALALRAYEAHQTYATDLNRPVEVPASDQAHLLKWIQHRLSMPIRIPDLGPQGWNLLGGRVLPGELGPAAFLIYGNGVERLGLYVARINTHQSDTFTVYDNGAGLASVAYWVDEPVGYALTTSRDSGWLDRNGAALYQSVRAQARDNASAF